MKRIELPHDHTLVLQQIQESGQEDFSGLAEGLQFGRERLAHIVQALHHKRLIVVERSTTYADALLRLSSKGKRFVAAMLPEAQLSASQAF